MKFLKTSVKLGAWEEVGFNNCLQKVGFFMPYHSYATYGNVFFSVSTANCVYDSVSE